MSQHLTVSSNYSFTTGAGIKACTHEKVREHNETNKTSVGYIEIIVTDEREEEINKKKPRSVNYSPWKCGIRSPVVVVWEI